MFLSRNKKNNVYPCKSQFYYTKVGFNGVKIIKACFRDAVYHFDNLENNGVEAELSRRFTHMAEGLFYLVQEILNMILI